MAQCRCFLKKGRCHTHPNNCRLHCAICVPPEARRKRGRPRRDSQIGARSSDGGPIQRRRTSRTAAPSPGSLKEVDEHVGLVEQVPAVFSATNAVWDGTSMASLSRFFEQDRIRSSIPSKAIRNRKDAKEHMSIEDWNKLIRAMQKISSKLASALCENDANQLVHDAGLSMAGVSNDTKPIAAAVFEHYRQSKKASLERRSLAAVLAASLESRRRILNVSRSVQQPLKPIGSTVFDRALRDSSTMLHGQPLTKTTIRRKRFNEDCVKEALSFLLSEDYVGVLSWGTKKVKLSSNETVQLPSLVRKKSRTIMFKEYLSWFKEQHNDSAVVHLPRSTVFEILKTVTNGQRRALCSRLPSWYSCL